MQSNTHARVLKGRIARVATLLTLLPLLLGCALWPFQSNYEDTPTEGSAAVDLLKIETLAAVQNGGSEPTFSVDADHTITEIMTYHRNDGSGQTPGEILLTSADGDIYGPWQAEGSDGQEGVPNAYWHVYPGEVVPGGTYTVSDSNPATWAQNEETGGLGVTFVYGVPAQ